MDKFLEKLEQFKRKGNYSVSVYYGAATGADDFDIPIENRVVRITGVPVGYLGSAKVLIHTTVEEFLEMDLNSVPKQVSNPPGNEIDDYGYYYWGTESALQIITPETLYKS